MKVPIRSKLTFCVSCSKSFKVHFKYKKYFIEDSWIQKKWIRWCLACSCAMKASDQICTGHTMEGKKREWGMGGQSNSHTPQTTSAGCTCIFDHPSCSFLHFDGDSFTRGVQFTMSCHGFHLHNSRNALFMWSAAFLHQPKMGFFSGP